MVKQVHYNTCMHVDIRTNTSYCLYTWIGLFTYICLKLIHLIWLMSLSVPVALGDPHSNHCSDTPCDNK